MKSRFSLLAACSLMAIATAATAANREDTFSLSPVIGGITFAGTQHLQTNPVYGLRAGYNFTKAIGVEALFDYAHTKNTRSGIDGGHVYGGDVDFYRYGGELLYHFMPDEKLVPYLAAGYGVGNFHGNTVFTGPPSALLGSSNSQKGVFSAGLGAKYFLNDDLALRGDVRDLLYTFNKQTRNTIEYTVGLYIPFGAKPVVKPVEPPPAPAPPPPPPKVEPPPPPPVPTAALTATPASVTKGQSATLNWKSQNASGCDIQPGIGPVPPQGARTITPADSTTYNLSCSGAGGTATSAAGVTVVLPPPPPPPPKPKAAERFCGKPATIVVEFDTNKSDIKTKYDEDLNKLGTFLKEWPKAKGEISGHTDNVGSDKYNLGLSQRRAASVKKYLVEKFGIAPERLTTEGYGETKPIATNKTKEGRQLNRRIETNFTCD
jgi:OOP family OmpA-OmpF porin